MKYIKVIWKFLIQVLLFIVAVVLLILLTPWGIVEYIIKNFYKKRFWKGLGIFGELVLSVAAQIDMIGCVLFQAPFNRLLITKEGYKFGSIWDTISFVLGMNEKLGTLTPMGLWLCNVLSKFEADHCKITVEHKLEYMKKIKQRLHII